MGLFPWEWEDETGEAWSADPSEAHWMSRAVNSVTRIVAVWDFTCSFLSAAFRKYDRSQLPLSLVPHPKGTRCG